MTDIVERLRAWKQVRTTPYPIGYYLDTGLEAADEIVRLRELIAELDAHEGAEGWSEGMRERIDAALGGEGK